MKPLAWIEYLRTPRVLRWFPERFLRSEWTG